MDVFRISYHAVNFSVAPGQCKTIAPGTTCGVQINFAPSVIGQSSAILIINDNASTSPQSVSLTGNGVSAYTLQATTFSATATSGATATYQITAASAPGFTGVVQFTCMEVPPYATCSLQPASVDFCKVTTANITVTVSTTTKTNPSALLRSMDFMAGFICVPVLLISQRPRAIALVLVFIFATSIFGCEAAGGGTSGIGATDTSPMINTTPPGGYNISIYASSTIDSKYVGLILQVMQ